MTPSSRKTAVSTPTAHTEHTTFLLLGSGVIFLGAAALMLLLFWPQPAAYTLSDSAPFPASQPPQQTAVRARMAVRTGTAVPFTLTRDGQDWTLTPRAHYQIAARVVGRKTYHDWQSPLIPLDLALAWGEMSDPAVDAYIRWSQSGRWYFYRVDAGAPVSAGAVRTQSANVHIIPANETLAQALRQVHEGDVIFLAGQLVDVETTLNGRTQQANTSLSRRDGGAGSCEILYVEQLLLNDALIE